MSCDPVPPRSRDLSRDPIVNVIHNGIKKGIRVVLDNECWMAVVTLTLSGMDTMAYLGMPAGKQDVSRIDFVDWVERYIRFDGPHQPFGLDLYGARCGVLHAYRTASRLSREGKCRQVIYKYQSGGEPVHYRPEVDPSVAIVSIEALAQALFAGIDRFLVDLFKDNTRGALADQRFHGMFHTVPAKDVHQE
ncbi:MAG: hypothetical protein ACJ79W_16200 [Myxococcales bacterium]